MSYLKVICLYIVKSFRSIDFTFLCVCGVCVFIRLEYQFLRQSLLSVSSSFVLVLRDRLVADHRRTIQG